MEKLVIKNNKVIRNDKYSTITLSVIFPCEDKTEYLFYLPLLSQILLNSSYEYKDEKSYKHALREKLIIKQNIYTSKYNKNLYIEFVLTVPNPLKIKDYDLDSSLKFFSDTIYKPNIIDNHFNEQVFNREKEYLKQEILQGLKNVNRIAYNSFINIVDDIGIYKDDIYNNMDLIDSSNSKELYEIYKKLIYDNKPIITMYGDIDENIENKIKKYLKTDDEVTINIDYNNFFKPFAKIKDIQEESKYNQSVLFVAYKVKNMSVDDIIYINMINDILSYGSNNLLTKKLRQENSFVYSSYAWSYAISGLLVNEVYINNNSKEEVVEKIKELYEELKNKEFLTKCLNKEKEELYYNMIRAKDNITKPLNDYVIKLLKKGYTMEERYKFYEEINIEELLDFIDRLTLDTIYFLRGEFNE